VTVIDDLLSRVDARRIVDATRTITALSVPDGSEGPRARAVGALLAHPRIEVHLDPVLPGRPNVIARVRGTRSGDAPGLLLNGHIDAGFVQDGWRHDPLDAWEEDGKLYGGAVSDMLGGVAAIVEVLLAAADGPPLPGDLVLLANMYHDSNGLGTKYALASEDGWPRYGINGEPTSNTILTRHGGCVKFEIAFTGRVAHISRSEEGVDALAAAVRVYDRIRTLDFTYQPDPELPTLPRLQVGVLQGGFAAAAVAPTAVLQGDLRTVPGMDWGTVRADLERAVAESCPPDVTARVGCLVRQRPHVGPDSGPLMDALRAGHRLVTGADPAVNVERASQSFVTDAVDMAAAGIETLVYGPGAWHYEPNEWISVAEMADAARVYLATAAILMGVATGDAG
jgi:succinyl-diaminopimelate desuccinylase